MPERFYFNTDENLCMNESCLVLYPSLAEDLEPEDVLYSLRTQREYCGWFECEVSSDISDKFC